MDLVDTLFAVLSDKPGLKAVDIAKIINRTKQDVNRTLHNTPEKFVKITPNTWKVKDEEFTAKYYPDIKVAPMLPPGAIVIHGENADYSMIETPKLVVTNNFESNCQIFSSVEAGSTVVLDIKNIAVRQHAISALMLSCSLLKARE